MVIVGPGVLAGTIAIGIRSIGGCAKLIYESIEEIDPKQVSDQSDRWYTCTADDLWHRATDSADYRRCWRLPLGHHVRGSTILALLAQAVSVQLNASINVLAWTQVSTILIVILGTVFVSEYISAKVRGAII